MISIALILLLSVALIAGLALFWREIVEWIKKAVTKIKEVLGLEPTGTRTFISRTTEGLRNKSKYYYVNKLTQEYEEVVYTKPVNESDVPADILAKVRYQSLEMEVSTTDELRLALNV